jgi:adenosylcobinamide amidohydrolase
MNRLFTTECRPPWLIARFADRQRMVSWSLNRPGIVESDTVAWLQVSDADLTYDVDPLELLERRLAERGISNAVGLMTAREVSHHHFATSGGGGVVAEALVTLGLTNSIELDALGLPYDEPIKETVGTINMLVAVSCPLRDEAMLEAMSVTTIARTAALLTDHGRIVGTGTDCVVVTCPNAAAGARFAGLHTGIGQHVAASVFRATRAARTRWEEAYAT